MPNSYGLQDNRFTNTPRIVDRYDLLIEQIKKKAGGLLLGYSFEMVCKVEHAGIAIDSLPGLAIIRTKTNGAIFAGFDLHKIEMPFYCPQIAKWAIEDIVDKNQEELLAGDVMSMDVHPLFVNQMRMELSEMGFTSGVHYTGGKTRTMSHAYLEFKVK